MSYGQQTWRIKGTKSTHRGPEHGFWPDRRKIKADEQPNPPPSPIMLCGLIIPGDDALPVEAKSRCERCERNWVNRRGIS